MVQTYKLLKVIPIAGARKSFLERNKRWMSIVGALIVISTFVAKEWLRDRWKEAADNLNLAESVYSIAKDTSRGEEYYRMLQNDISDLQEELLDAHLLSQPEQISELVHAQSTETGRVKSELEAISPLVGELPKKSHSHTRLDELKKQNGQTMNAIDKIYDEAFPRNHLDKSQKGRPALEEVLQKARALSGQVNDVSNATKKFLKDVQEEAEEMRKTNKAESEAAAVGSGVLYFIGWLIGLAGHLYGEDDLVTME